jgi:hypothetical protein
MSDSPATRILEAWAELEAALRQALPVCSVAPPTQPSELLSALRINHRIGPEEEARILGLREIRNRVSVDPQEPPGAEADAFEAEVSLLISKLAGRDPAAC